jgi:hypothetical protein
MVCVSALCACFYAPHHVRVVLTTLGDVQRRLALLPGSDVDSLASMGNTTESWKGNAYTSIAYL